MKRYTVGVDFGTLSARAVVLDTQSGKAIACASMEYPHGVIDGTLPSGTPVPPQSAFQHPADYLQALAYVIPEALKRANVTPKEVAGLGIDFTSCTLVSCRKDGTPLCMEPQYTNRPQAYVKLWKHHASQPEAERMTAVAIERQEKWLGYCGGKLSSEWALPKIYETLLRDEEIYQNTDRFCEAGDWLSFLLTGEESYALAFASFKFNWIYPEGYPSDDYLTAVDPRLAGLVGTKLPNRIHTVDGRAGVLNEKGAAMTGLLPGTPLALPMLDAEVAMLSLNVTAPGTTLLILGTSGVQMVHDTQYRPISGTCGCAKDGVIPGLTTYEAGQAGLGDSFEWFVRTCVPASYTEAARAEGKNIHQYLRERAQALRVGESGLLALDWFNGNRCTLQDADLSGLIVGLHIGTRPEEIYRAMIESTAYGMRRIMENYRENGIETTEIRAAGGIAKKDPMMMQIYADVCNREILVMDSDQAPAVGSAIYAAVAGGLYPTAVEAAQALAVKDAVVYRPIPENVAAYEQLYAEYCRLYDYFGKGENPVMKRLRHL